MNASEIYQTLEKAVAAHGAGKFPEALQLYNQVIEADPRNIEALKRLSVLLLQTGQAAIAYDTIKRAQEINPKSRSVMEIYGAAAMANEDFTMAVRVFEPLSKNQPVNPLYFLELSKAEFGLNNYKRSIAAFLEHLKYVPTPKPENCFTLGHLYFRNRQPLEAAEWLDKALVGGVENSEILAIRANCYIHQGDKAAAVKFFEKALTLDPDNIEAHYQHRNLVKTEKGDPIFAHLEGLKGSPRVDGNAELHLYFLLGKLYQRIGEDEKAIENYQKGNVKTDDFYQTQKAVYTPEGAKAEFDFLRKHYSGAALKKVSYKGSDSEIPVFIVGLPRSGTTLLEQIITAHPRAEGRGEVDQMHYIHFEAEEGLRKGESLDALFKAHGDKWQADYLAALGAGPGTERVTDKLPANTRSVGLISRLFPKAKIIHIVRDPMDVGFSIYSNPFDSGHPYSTDLEKIGDFIKQTRDLMDYWGSELDFPILTVHYEDLVANQKAKSREVIEFLGLDWDDACLSFHTQDRAAMTLSSIQVREPISAKSIARWKRFEGHLGPLKTGLGKNLAGA